MLIAFTAYQWLCYAYVLWRDVNIPVKPQIFGGPWTCIKTDLVAAYFKFFNTALKNKPFKRVYIDAFAGSGAFRYIEDTPAVSLFGPRDASLDIHPGSAQRALSVQPGFDRIIFIEKKRNNVKQLEALIRESGHPAATVEQGDCNHVLSQLCRRAAWRKSRGVIFLDPFGMKVDWSTLEWQLSP